MEKVLSILLLFILFISACQNPTKTTKDWGEDIDISSFEEKWELYAVDSLFSIEFPKIPKKNILLNGIQYNCKDIQYFQITILDTIYQIEKDTIQFLENIANQKIKASRSEFIYKKNYQKNTFPCVEYFYRKPTQYLGKQISIPPNRMELLMQVYNRTILLSSWFDDKEVAHKRLRAAYFIQTVISNH